MSSVRCFLAPFGAFPLNYLPVRARCDNNPLMSVFQLSKLAALLGKDPRTVRRWCEAGFFGKSAYQTRGGHWRVRGTDVADLAAGARNRAKGFERRRLTKEQAAMLKLQLLSKRMAKMNRAMQVNFRLSRAARMAAKYLALISSTLADKSNEELEMLGLSNAFTDRLAWEPMAAPRIIAAAVCVWMLEADSTQTACIARRIGVSRRSLMRRFGHHWPQAQLLFAQMRDSRPDIVTAWQSAGTDHRTGQKLRERISAVMPQGMAASPEMLRAMEGALRGSNTAGRDENQPTAAAEY
jgi:phage terminase Nu1 subunit (DNA packaging protein)